LNAFVSGQEEIADHRIEEPLGHIKQRTMA
jgi:hypothetical protein